MTGDYWIARLVFQRGLALVWRVKAVPFRLSRKLLEGDAAVLSLLRRNPFPDHPPRFVRADLCEYRFASPAERSQTGHWWTRDRIAAYFPVTSLK
jgi:hypothetical protein